MFLNRLVAARGFKNFDMRAETMEASFVTNPNESFAAMSDFTKSQVPDRQQLNRA